jgi:hypothetical protein
VIGLGEVYRITADVRDADGTLTDPASATLTVTLPDGSTVTPTVPAPAATGKVVVDYPTTMAGRHVWRLVTSGPVTASADMFEVLPADAGQIVSMRDAKEHLNIPLDRTDDDRELLGFLVAVTAVVENHIGAVLRAEQTTTFDGGLDSIVLPVTPILSVTSVTESGTAVDASGYSLDAASGVMRRLSGGRPIGWRAGIGNVVVDYVVGRTSVAANVSRAALIILKHMWETQRNAGGGRPGLASEVSDPATYVVNPSSFAIPYRALELLGKPVSGVA